MIPPPVPRWLILTVGACIDVYAAAEHARKRAGHALFVLSNSVFAAGNLVHELSFDITRLGRRVTTCTCDEASRYACSMVTRLDSCSCSCHGGA